MSQATKQGILVDPRVRAIKWRDLQSLSKLETVKELCLFIPWFVGTLYFAIAGYWLVSMALSFVLFLAYLRLAHDCFHYNIGLPRWAHEALIFGLSALMLGSNHAVQYSHLRHHKYCLGEKDIEATSAGMPWWKAILWGPVFPLKLIKHALQSGNLRIRRWVQLEVLLNVVILVLVFAVFDNLVLQFYFWLMLLAQCLTAFFAVWTVHHHCDEEHYIARTQRGYLKNLMMMNMFFHIEHHLFPKIPTSHLPKLAKRLDVAAPELQSKRVF